MDKNQLKIAFLNISQGKVNRGSEVFVAELSKRLGKNHKVDIISGSKLPGKRWPVLWRFYLDPHGISIFLFTLRQLPKIIKNRYDVVIPLNGGWQAELTRLATWLYGGKEIISGQSGFGWDDRNNLWSFPDVFVTLSKKGIKWSRRTNPFVKIKYIPNGVDTTVFKPGISKNKTKLKKPIVLCASALEETKRIDLAIKAVAKMGSTSLLLVGDGSQKDRLLKLGKEKLGDRFLLDSKAHSEMPDVYRSADVFTLPSYKSEAFGIVYVEALACGLPVVATDDAQRKEIVGESGILVDTTDIDKYASALTSALKTNWGNKPSNQSQKFSWDKIGKEYEKLILALSN